MYLGKIVEYGDTEEVLAHPLHPYTRALISAVPIPDPTLQRELPAIKGGVSRPVNPSSKCRFLERCPVATKFCAEADHPTLEDKGSGHFTACYMVK